MLPDYQGCGIGGRMTDFIGDLMKKDGKSFISTTSNMAMIHSRKKNPKWITTRIGRTSSGSGKIQNKHIKGSTSSQRITVSFKYIG